MRLLSVRSISDAIGGFRTLAISLVVAAGLPVSAVADPIAVLFLDQERKLSRPGISKPVEDEGFEGARLGMAENGTTARFTGQKFLLHRSRFDAARELAAQVASIVDEGIRFVVADLEPDTLRHLMRVPAARQLAVFNSRAPDDFLREESCASALFHTIPSRAMLADALAQYLVWKKWRSWFLVSGPERGDRLYAGALRRAARKFGAELVVSKEWSFRTTNWRADTGHVTLQTEIPAFTRVTEHDVLVVADESDSFGEYLIGRTALPRPVVGTHGLVSTGWSHVNEQWGATQLQDRFSKQSGRRMTAIDYAAWAAVRSIGEAAFRTRSSEPGKIMEYLRGSEFLLAGFKGQGQSFRSWDGQMRQPILIAGPRLLVSASPQPGFLHRTSSLDTLGIDREESRCRR